MCGIAGYLGPAEIGDERIDRCLELMRHRGPDDAGRHRWRTPDGRTAYLLNTRLAIIDLDPRANQPFQARAGSGSPTTASSTTTSSSARGSSATGVAVPHERPTPRSLAAALAEDGWDALDALRGDVGVRRLRRARRLAHALPRPLRREAAVSIATRTPGSTSAPSRSSSSRCSGGGSPSTGSTLRRYLVNGYKALYKTGATFFEGLARAPAGGRCCGSAVDGRRTPSAYWTPRFDPERRR